MTTPIRNLAISPERPLTQIKAKIIADDLFDSTLVFLSLRNQENPQQPPSQEYIAIEPAGDSLDPGVAAGAGNTCPLMNGGAVVTLNLSTQVDETGRDDAFIAGASLGTHPRVRQVVKSLEMYDPTDGDLVTPRYVFAEPMRLAPGSLTTLPRTPESGWGRVRMRFEYKYILDLVS